MLEEHLGKALRCQDIADYLGVDEKTVRQYYKELGGIRLGRLYVFFEKEVVHAIQEWTQMGCPSSEESNRKQAIFTTKAEALDWEVKWRKKTVGEWKDPEDPRNTL